MAFGKVDSVENHITGERKQVTNIDLDKEYGKRKSYEKVLYDIIDYQKELNIYKTFCLETILTLDPSWGSKDYYNFIIASDKLSWNKDMLEGLPTSQLGTIRAHLERIIDSNKNPINNI